MASSHNAGTSRRDQSQGLVPSCVPTLSFLNENRPIPMYRFYFLTAIGLFVPILSMFNLISFLVVYIKWIILVCITLCLSTYLKYKLIMSKLAFIELVTLLKYIMINIFYSILRRLHSLIAFVILITVKHLGAVISYHFIVLMVKGCRMLTLLLLS